MRRGVAVAALVALLVGGAAPQSAAARLIAPGRWVRYTVALAPQGSWSTWYAQAPWPVRFRFKCSQGALIMNAQNTSRVDQRVRMTAWDAEIDGKSLDGTIDDGYAERNEPFSLPTGQSVTLPLVRPQICNGSVQRFAFGVVYD